MPALHPQNRSEPSVVPESPPIVDVGILTIRDDEFRAVLNVFKDKAGLYRGRREYTLRYADAGGGARYTVAILRQIEQGNGEAQDAARDLLDDLNPALLLVVGIAGGIPSEDYTLGDVVLSTRINDYSVEARKTRAATTYSLSGGPIAKGIAAGLANLAGREHDLGAWTDDLPRPPKVTWSGRGRLYGPKKWREKLKECLRTHFGKNAESRAPIYITGPIASSDRLVKDPKVLFPWISTARNVLAIEMESGGVYRAVRDRCPMLAIRGISDLVGLKRNDSWTEFACRSAAAFTRAYLRTQPVPPKQQKNNRPDPDSTVERPKNETIQSIFANLAPLVAFPPKLFVAPATCGTYKEAWAILRKRARKYISSAWVLHNNTIISFVAPEDSRLRLVCDTAAVEEHESDAWAYSDNDHQRRIFVQLLNQALVDDLRLHRVYFDRKDRVFSFAASENGEPRQVEYQNVKHRSSITVVNNYTSSARDGRSYPYIRHLGFEGRFRLLDGQWHLTILPTYRFTTDGRNKYRFHDDQLRGIKRIEKNRAVLSQVLLWNHVLCSRTKEGSGEKLLRFGKVPHFRVEVPPAPAFPQEKSS